MTIRSSVFIATSLDGYIARQDGSIDWLENANQLVPAGEDCGYFEFIAGVDVLVMGRNTFEKVLEFDPWPYGATPVFVMTSRPLALPDHLAHVATVCNEPPRALLARLESAGFRHVYVDGGITIQRFFDAGAIDRITVTTIPVLLGSGRTLFGALGQDVALRHLTTKTYDFGFVQSTWEVLEPKQ